MKLRKKLQDEEEKQQATVQNMNPEAKVRECGVVLM